jgi:hypothetical protein
MKVIEFFMRKGAHGDAYDSRRVDQMAHYARLLGQAHEARLPWYRRQWLDVPVYVWITAIMIGITIVHYLLWPPF